MKKRKLRKSLSILKSNLKDSVRLPNPLRNDYVNILFKGVEKLTSKVSGNKVFFKTIPSLFIALDRKLCGRIDLKKLAETEGISVKSLKKCVNEVSERYRAELNY